MKQVAEQGSEGGALDAAQATHPSLPSSAPPPLPSIFGRQRPPEDIAALGLLGTGFFALGVGFLILTGSWVGLLLPIAYLLGVFPPLRTDVREIELRDEQLLVRTFFREYALPRANITGVVRTPQGVAVEVLNGNRYLVTPPGVDVPTLATALHTWLTRPPL